MADQCNDLEGRSQSAYRLPLILRLTFGVVLVATLYMVSRASYATFHTIAELASIAVTWSVFLLLWNARRYQENEAFLILGAALFFSGAIDLFHTMSYKGIGLFSEDNAGGVATQFWIAGRWLETLGWLAFATLFGRKGYWTISATAFGALAMGSVASILVWHNFPECNDPETGLTTFKLASEYAMVALLVASLLIFRRRATGLDPVVLRNLTVAIGLVALGELAFTTYRDEFGLANMFGHFMRVVSRYVLYLALIHISVNRPYSLFFRQLHREKENLAESEARWRSLSQSSPDHILDIDGDLLIRFANYPGPGLEMQDMLGTSILEFVPPDDRDRVERILRRAQHSSSPARYETSFRDEAGKEIHYETTVVARGASEDGKVGLTLVARNISDRKRHNQVFEARLRISEFALTSDIPDLLQKVLDEGELLTDSKIGFFHFVDEDQENLHLQNWSSRTLREMCTAEGRGAHYPVSRAGVWAECLHTRRPAIHNDYATMAGRKGMPEGHAPLVREVVIPLLREDRVVAVLGVGNKETDYDESDVSLLAEMADLAWDIVVRKRAELALIETERRLAHALAHLPGMVFRCANDENWTMLFVSAGCRDLTGYEAAELIGNQVVTYGSLIHPEDEAYVNEVVQRGLAANETYELTYRIIDRQGALKWVWEQGRGDYRDGRFEAIEGFIYDITEQVRAQEERQALEKQVLEAQKLESLGVLAGGIAHDFNNLLQTMLGFAELAELQTGPDHPAQECITRVMEAASRAADLTRQMLAFAGRGKFVISDADVSEQVDGMASLLEGSVSKSITFVRELEQGLPKIPVDIGQFHQVVMNLVTNAAEAVGEAGGRLVLRTGIRDCDADYLARSAVGFDAVADGPVPGSYVYIEVEDEGCGMDAETAARIFEPFYTTKFVGRGLGLAAVQGIIRGHNGALIIESEVGRGTTMRALFPVVPCVGDPEIVPASGRSTPDGDYEPLVLVIDDEMELRRVICETLTRRGFRVITAGDGNQGLERFAARCEEIDCVLLDVVMPNMGGEECMRRLQELSPHARVVLMSGWTESEIERRFTGCTYAGLLAKPFRAGQLLGILDEVIPARPC